MSISVTDRGDSLAIQSQVLAPTFPNEVRLSKAACRGWRGLTESQYAPPSPPAEAVDSQRGTSGGFCSRGRGGAGLALGVPLAMASPRAHIEPHHRPLTALTPGPL